MHWRRPPSAPHAGAALLPTLIVVLAVILGLLFSCAARADGLPMPAPLACGSRAGILDQLKEKYGEAPRGIGLTDRGAVIELLAAEDGSFTILLTMANGVACLIVTGQGWEETAAPKGQDL